MSTNTHVAKDANGRKGKAPDVPPGAEAFLKDLMGHLDRTMREKGSMPLTCYLQLRNASIIPFVYDGEPDDVAAKDGFADLIALLVAGLDAACLAVGMEAWALRREDAEKVDADAIRKHGISRHPTRIEVLSIICEWPDVVVTAQAEIRREGKRYAGHTAPDLNTFHPNEMESRFGGAIGQSSAEERAQARIAIAQIFGSSASALFALADEPRPRTN